VLVYGSHLQFIIFFYKLCSYFNLNRSLKSVFNYFPIFYPFSVIPFFKMGWDRGYYLKGAILKSKSL